MTYNCLKLQYTNEDIKLNPKSVSSPWLVKEQIGLNNMCKYIYTFVYTSYIYLFTFLYMSRRSYKTYIYNTCLYTCIDICIHFICIFIIITKTPTGNLGFMGNTLKIYSNCARNNSFSS